MPDPQGFASLLGYYNKEDRAARQSARISETLPKVLGDVLGSKMKEKQAATAQGYKMQQLGKQAEYAKQGRAETAVYSQFPGVAAEEAGYDVTGKTPMDIQKQQLKNTPTLWDLMKQSQKNAKDQLGFGGAFSTGAIDKEMTDRYEKMWRKDFGNLSVEFGYDKKAAMKAVDDIEPSIADTQEEQELSAFHKMVRDARNKLMGV